MYINRLRLIIFLLLYMPVMLSGSCVTDTSTQDYPNTRSFIEKESKKLMRRYHLPALAISLVEDQDVIYEDATGLIDIENNVPASTTSVFKLWSVAKAFTALAIFKGLEDGLIDLDAPITNYLPDFSIQSRFGGETVITVRDLLAHRAGLPRHEGLLPEERKKDLAYLEKFERGASSCHLAYPVGYRYKYSNLGYDLLGRIIESTRNMGYYQYMKEHVLNPSGMHNSNFYREGIDDTLQIALGYEYHNRSYYPYGQYNINNVPSGNLYATIEDLSSFLSALFKNQLFSRESTLKKMFEVQYSRPDDPQRMGLGWKTALTRENELVFWHDGGPTEGIGSLLAYLPDRKIGIALVGNGTKFSGAYSMAFALDIIDHLLEEKNGGANNQATDVFEMKMDGEQLQSYEGKYVAFGDLIEVKARKNMLKTRMGGFGMNLIPVGEDEFTITNWMEKTGLTRFARLPLDLNQIRVSILKTGVVDSAIMVFNYGNVNHEIYPKYPSGIEFPMDLKSLAGHYRIAELLPDGRINKSSDRSMQIKLEQGVLYMSGVYGPIVPFDEKTLIILGSPFEGETMEYRPDSGYIIHQKMIFIPMEPD